ncbi:hypothetical protein VDGL01_11274 [Verticillium dahliae]
MRYLACHPGRHIARLASLEKACDSATVRNEKRPPTGSRHTAEGGGKVDT